MLRCAYFSEELEQWMTDGVAMETVPDGRGVVYSATHLTAFSDCLRQPACESVCVHVMLVGCCVAGVLVLVFGLCSQVCSSLQWDLLSVKGQRLKFMLSVSHL